MLTTEKIHSLRHRYIFDLMKAFPKYPFKINNETQNLN
jgi:hypothetical protein